MTKQEERLDERSNDKSPGYSIPYRYANELKAISYRSAGQSLAGAAHDFRRVLGWIAKYEVVLRGLSGPPPTPRWDQDWFTGLDGAAAYALVREIAPKKILEVGSGHSTRFMAQALRDGEISCSHVCIDPAPRATLNGIGVEHRRTLLSQDDLLEIRDLQSEDILFVDSSHVMMPGTDVDLIFSEFLGALNKGVIVHLHDIFLPDPYPKVWTWRGYNEQCLAAAILTLDAFQPIFSSHYVRTRMAEELTTFGLGKLPRQQLVPESSLWMTRL